MKFVCLGCLDKGTWGKLSPAEQQKMVEECTAFDLELHAKGHFADGFALQDSADATTIRWQGGKAIVCRPNGSMSRDWWWRASLATRNESR